MTSLQGYEIWKEGKKCKLPTGSKVVQLGQTTKFWGENNAAKNHRPISQSTQTVFLLLPNLLAWGKRYILAFRLLLLFQGVLSFPVPWGRCSRIAHRMPWMKMAMMAALIRPEMGTVTNQAMKMFLNRRQSTAFLERSHPTATTEPTWKHSSRHKHPTSNSWLQIIHPLKLHNRGSCSIFGESTRLFVSLTLVTSPMSQSPPQTAVFDRPTLQWVVETGRPMFEATTTVRAEANSMLKPLQGNEKQHPCHLRPMSLSTAAKSKR